MIDINLIGMGTKEIAKDERTTRVKKNTEKSAFFSSKDNVLTPKALRFLSNEHRCRVKTDYAI